MATYSDVNNGHKGKQFLQFGFRYGSMLNIPSSSFHKKTMNICTITWCCSGRQDNCNSTFIIYASCCFILAVGTHIICCTKGVVTLLVTVWSDQLTWHHNFKYIKTQPWIMWLYSTGGMIIGRGKPNCSEERLHQCHSIHHPMWTPLRLNLGFICDKLVTDCLTYDTD